MALRVYQTFACAEYLDYERMYFNQIVLVYDQIFSEIYDDFLPL